MVEKIYKWLLVNVTAVFLLCFTTAYTDTPSDTLPAYLFRKLAVARTDLQRMDISIQLGMFYVNKPGEQSADIKKATEYAQQVLDLSRRIKSKSGELQACILFSQISRERRDDNNGMVWATRALNLAIDQRKPEGRIDAYIEISNYYSIETDSGLNKKTAYYEDAVGLLRHTEPRSIRFANALKFLGDLHNLQLAHTRSIAELMEALSVYKANNYKELQDIYSLIGDVYNKMDSTREALYYNLLAVKTLESFKDSSATACAAYNRVGMLYINLSEPLPARVNLEKALLLARRNNDNTSLLHITYNLSLVYERLQLYNEGVDILKYALARCPPDPAIMKIGLTGRIIDCYVHLKQYGHAANHYKNIAAYITDKNRTDVISQNSRLSSIEYFVAIRRFDRLPQLFEVFEYTAGKNGNMKQFAAIEQQHYRADSAAGNYKSALQHHQLYKIYNDSLVRRNHDRQLVEMEVRYEAARKDTALALQSRSISMLQHENELQQRMLRSQRTVRNLSFLGAALFGLLLIVGFSRYRLKQIANRDLHEKQEEVNRQNEHLRDLLTEREWLLKEIHHRVKNNLQIIISLLNSQSVYLTDPNALNALQESQNRIFSVSLIHQKLYQDKNIAGISMSTYIRELTMHLTKTFGTAGRIRFQVQAEDLLLDVAEAVPLGLIMNEAITNAMKYAFPNGNEGIIRVIFGSEDIGKLSLEIADDGKGLAEEIDMDNPPTLGMSLIGGLSEQLGADLTLTGSPGVTIRLVWKRRKLINS